ncbi:DUF3237 domain-containing protein [Salibacterium halotolerans]|uniref:UPF0311 protein SAMN05518683_1167 n=1 Tax=Salibacterium halotolerans TaxID=1884432 RepID=A0A1I5VF05_9BACI|nr:DUF3237 domain-containing protein [Salibacterium halotolerans]SFQ06134.1 Protein of unknown function [Salibacterium halotolerans]
MSIETKHVFDLTIYVDSPIEVGPVSAGERRIINITGGTFEGKNMRGVILPGGADYQVIRRDGVTEVVAHYSLQTTDGTPIYIVNRGYRYGPEEIINKLKQGEPVPDNSYYFKTMPTFEVSDERYAFLNRNLFVGIGTREPDCVKLKVFQVL